MVTVSGAQSILDCGEDELLAMVDDGRIAWAWNIACKEAKRREVRLLARCVEALQKREALALSEKEVHALLVPHQKPFLQHRETMRALHCKSTHLIDLITEESLLVLDGTSWRRGPGGSPVIKRESFMEFLNKRRIV